MGDIHWIEAQLDDGENAMNEQLGRSGLTVVTSLGVSVAALMLAAGAGAGVSCDNENSAVPASTPSTVFTQHDDGTVTHLGTGLMWMRCSLGQTWESDPGTCEGNASSYVWNNALNAVLSFNAPGGFNGEAGFAGYDDWRMPNRNELATIVEESCWLPMINATLFPNTPGSWYLSASPSAVSAEEVWHIGFGYGTVDSRAKSSTGVVRLVRGGF